MIANDSFKILMVTPVFDQWGTETYIVNLAEYLKNKNIYATVISDGGMGEKELLKRDVDHIKVSCLSKKSLSSLVKAVFILRRVIKKKNFEIIHASSVYTTIISKLAVILCFKRKIKVIMTLHGGPTRDIERKAAKLLNIFSDKVIALSENGKASLTKYGLDEGKITIINNGVKPLHKEETCQKEKIVIGSCGRLTEQKGYEYLIKAAEKIDMPDLEFWIAGDGEMKETLEKQVQDFEGQDRIKFLGFRKDVNEIMNKMDIFILPSLWEPFGIVIIEAMSLGKTVIATNVGGIPEVLGDCGILINPANSEEIVDAVKLLVGNAELRNSLGQKAEERFYKNFTQEIMGEKTIRVYEEVLKNNHNK